MKSWQKKFINLLGILIVAALFYFLGKEFFVNWDKIKDYEFTFNIPLLLLSTFFYLLFFFFLSIGWYLVLKFLHHHLPIGAAFCIYLATQLAKYIPGKIWIVLARMKMCQPYKISNSHIILSTTIETFLEIFAGSLISLLAFAQLQNLGSASLWMTIGFGILGLIVLHPKIFYPIINLFLHLTKKELIAKERQASFPVLLGLLVPYLLSILALGLGSFLFLKAFYPIGWEHFLALTSLTAFSYIVSMLAVFVPSGLGVREVIIYEFLKTITPAGIALLFSVLSRIWTIVAEILFVILVAPFFYKRKGTT